MHRDCTGNSRLYDSLYHRLRSLLGMIHTPLLWVNLYIPHLGSKVGLHTFRILNTLLLKKVITVFVIIIILLHSRKQSENFMSPKNNLHLCNLNIKLTYYSKIFITILKQRLKIRKIVILKSIITDFMGFFLI